MLNQAHISNQDTYYNRERPSIVGLVRTAPNVVLDLGCGAWDYQDAGVMDRTHLRFFTRRSCFNMLRDARFEVEQWRMLIAGRRYLLLNGVTFGLFAEFLGPQIVTLARKKTIQESKAGPTGDQRCAATSVRFHPFRVQENEQAVHHSR